MATQAQLAQYAINYAVAKQNAILQASAEHDTKGVIVGLLGMINLLAQAILNNGGGTIPNSLLTGAYSAAQSPTAPIQT
jgi:hypothetical protein